MFTATEFYEEVHGKSTPFLSQDAIIKFAEDYHQQKLTEEIPTIAQHTKNNYSEKRRPVNAEKINAVNLGIPKKIK